MYFIRTCICICIYVYLFKLHVSFQSDIQRVVSSIQEKQKKVLYLAEFILSIKNNFSIIIDKFKYYIFATVFLDNIYNLYKTESNFMLLHINLIT